MRRKIRSTKTCHKAHRILSKEKEAHTISNPPMCLQLATNMIKIIKDKNLMTMKKPSGNLKKSPESSMPIKSYKNSKHKDSLLTHSKKCNQITPKE